MTSLDALGSCLHWDEVTRSAATSDQCSLNIAFVADSPCATISDICTDQQYRYRNRYGHLLVALLHEKTLRTSAADGMYSPASVVDNWAGFGAEEARQRMII
jgi:hypothetical protein